ncbi:glutamyl-tRNA reductase [Fusobacterium necrophorum]|uniref:Glutamyl-tRNA reductase n=1 Tax=Fusobacterium necrophorum TaxID=859 RepID=A0A4Q2KZY7_9FUSO|nr:glutamyl-tRNA reductase [Fusobacterium necrophorum]RXZ69502.1 glutamyl-tRNA reductase [Fusobacterium necrophorum]
MNIKNFAMIGISHKILSMQEREEFIRQKPKALLEELFQTGKIQAYVDLSTCLRVEFYMELLDNTRLEEIRERFPTQRGLQMKQGEEALLHLAKVVCGFFSVIKGEDQILSQMKHAYTKALEEKHSSKLFNIIFQKIITLGKKFRTKSNIAHHALSLEAITLHSIQERIPNVQEKKILLLGVGELAQSILSLLVKEDFSNLYITNRSYHKAERISNAYQVNIIDFRDKYEWIAKVDIIISATSASHIVLEYERFLEKKQEKNYLMLDLAVPRDIDPRIANLEGVQVLNLDDIWKISKQHGSFREQLLDEYFYLLEEQIESIHKALSYYENKQEASVC